MRIAISIRSSPLPTYPGMSGERGLVNRSGCRAVRSPAGQARVHSELPQSTLTSSPFPKRRMFQRRAFPEDRGWGGGVINQSVHESSCGVD